MSIDEARQHKAMALLEFQEAQEDFDRLRAEAEALHARLAFATSFANALRRQNETYTGQLPGLRRKILEESEAYHSAMSLDLLIALDHALNVAQDRLNAAIEMKKTFGMK